MRTVPAHVLRYINQSRDNVEVFHWERRAFFEVVSEISQSVFYTWSLLTMVSLATFYWEWGYAWPFWIGVLYWGIHACRVGFMEYKRWQHEIHVVCIDKANGGGIYYRFSGWLDDKPAQDSITATIPAIIGPERPFAYKVWGWLTGEQMAFMSIHTPNGVRLNQKRVHPNLYRAIEKVRSQKRDETPSIEVTPRLKDAKELAWLIDMGKLDHRRGREMIEAIAQEAVWPWG